MARAPRALNHYRAALMFVAGADLRACRERLGESQPRFARRLACGTRSLQKWETVGHDFRDDVMIYPPPLPRPAQPCSELDLWERAWRLSVGLPADHWAELLQAPAVRLDALLWGRNALGLPLQALELDTDQHTAADLAAELLAGLYCCTNCAAPFVRIISRGNP